MSQYTAVAIAGNFKLGKMHSRTFSLLSDVFNADPRIGLAGHWEQHRPIGNSLGFGKEDYSRLADRLLCQWEWTGEHHYSCREFQNITVRHIAMTKASHQAIRKLIRLVTEGAEELEITALMLFEDDDGVHLERFWLEDGKVTSEVGCGVKFHTFKPFIGEEALWGKKNITQGRPHDRGK